MKWSTIWKWQCGTPKMCLNPDEKPEDDIENLLILSPLTHCLTNHASLQEAEKWPPNGISGAWAKHLVDHQFWCFQCKVMEILTSPSSGACEFTSHFLLVQWCRGSSLRQQRVSRKYYVLIWHFPDSMPFENHPCTKSSLSMSNSIVPMSRLYLSYFHFDQWWTLRNAIFSNFPRSCTVFYFGNLYIQEELIGVLKVKSATIMQGLLERY